MRERLKNIWFWVDIVLFLLCVWFYLMANPVLWLSREMRTPNIWYTLLALLCLAGKTVIDKKKLKIGDSGLPKMVIDQTPWYMKWAKLPIVKAKIGPKVVTMIADEKVFLQLPLRTEAKVVISGLYITEIKSVRGGIPPLPKKKKFFDRFKKNTEEAAKKEASKSKKNK